MATITTSTMHAINDTDANFREPCKFVHDTLALGWVQTTDTGQTNVAAITRPLATNAVMGYEIWRMNDGLQSTAPIFLKIEYGSGGGTANQFSFWFTFGTGSAGTGTLTGVLTTRTQVFGGNTATTILHSAFGSAAPERIMFALFVGVSTNHVWFACERTKDSAGGDTALGLLLAWGGAQQVPQHRSQVVPLSMPAPVPEIGIQCILSTNNPTAYTGDQGIGLMIPMLGVAIQPGMNVAVTMSNDFANFAQPSFTLYGAPRTYQHCGAWLLNLRAASSNSVDNQTRLLLRYE